MSYCPYCKEPIQPDWAYCRHCSHPLIVNLQDRLKQQYKTEVRNILDEEPLVEDSELYTSFPAIQDADLENKITKIDTLLQEKQDAGEPVGKILFEKASLYYKERDLNSALSILESALKSFKEEDDKLNTAISHNEIGIIQEDLGFFDNAIFHYKNSIEIFEQLEDSGKVIKVYNNIANTYYLLKDLENSYKYYNKALQTAQQQNLISERIKSSSNLVDILLYLNKIDEARNILQYNLVYFKEVEDAYGIIISLIKYGKLYYFLGEQYYEQAYQSTIDALELIKKIQDQISVYMKAQMEWEAYLILGKLSSIKINYSEAESYLFKSLESIRTFEFGENIKEGFVLESLAELYLSSGEGLKAIDHFLLAKDIYDKFGDDSKVADMIFNVGNAYFELLGNNTKSLEFFENALETFRSLDSTKEIADNLHRIGDVYVDLESYETALTYFQEAKDLYQEIFDAVNTNLVTEKIRSLTGNDYINF